MNKKENNSFDEDNISKEIYIEKISEDRKRLAKTFRKSTKEEFNKTYNDFLMSWKTEGHSTDNFISIKEIDDSEKIEALRDPLIVFFKKCCEDPELINNLVEILKRGGKVNSNDKPQSIQNFSLLSILFYKDLTDEQRIRLYGQETIEEEKNEELEEIDLFQEGIEDKDDDLFDVFNLNNEIIFLDKEKSYEERPADIVMQALMIASNERLSDFEINFYTQEIIKINSFYAQIITTTNAEDDEINIDIKRWKRTNLIPDVLILVEIDFEENSILFKGIITSEELFNLFQKDESSSNNSKLKRNNLLISKEKFIGGIDRIFYLIEIINPLSINKDKWYKSEESRTRKIKLLNRDVSFAFNQLSIYLKSGVPLVSSLEFASSDISNKNLKNIFLSISKELNNGEAFSSSISKYFDSNFIVSIIEVGEVAGILSVVLEKVSDYINQNINAQSKTRRLINIILCFSIVFYIISTSGLLVIFNNFPILTLYPIVIIAASISYIADYPKIYLLDKILFKIPILNKIIIKKFLGSFRLLVGAGIPITEALEISRYEIKNLYFRNYLNFAKNQLLKGKTFHESISQLYTESNQLKNMIKIGEESGELLYILEKLNDIYNLKVDREFKEIKDKSVLILYAAVLFLLATLIFQI